jgi:hypothetical protein
MTTPETRESGALDASKGIARVRSVPHPRYGLEQVEDLARRAFAIGARHCDQDAVAQAVHYKNSTNGAFKGIRAAASYFGLITYRDDKYLSVTEPWIEGFHSDDESVIRRLRAEAVQQPELYRQLIEEFSDRQLPSPEKLARQLYLTPKYGILKDAADTAARVFLESLRFAGLVDANNFLRLATETQANQISPAGPEVRPASAAAIPIGDVVPVGLPSTSQEGLDRIEVQLAGGRRAYLFVPVPLPAREKDRLKKYIDLILEPGETSGQVD